MSHLDAESCAGAFAAGLVESWATMATGIAATSANAKNLLVYFKT
jgi:hypothetical protein